MVERIRQILQVRQLSPTQFADALGVARPIISHVLSGRNKPSLEVVQKIIAAFPDLSLNWLLSGQGPMIAAVPTASQASTSTVPPVSENKRAKSTTRRAVEPLFETVAAPAPLKAANDQPAKTNSSVPAPEPVETPKVAPMPPAEVAPSAPLAAPYNAPQSVATTTPSGAAPSDMLSAFAEPGKTIRRIVIFYHDGTFSAYQPEVI